MSTIFIGWEAYNLEKSEIKDIVDRIYDDFFKNEVNPDESDDAYINEFNEYTQKNKSTLGAKQALCNYINSIDDLDLNVDYEGNWLGVELGESTNIGTAASVLKNLTNSDCAQILIEMLGSEPEMMALEAEF